MMQSTRSWRWQSAMDSRVISGYNYLTYLMASHENAYSTSCEIVGSVDGSINQVALHDFEIFKELFDYDFTDMESVMGVDCISMLHDYVGTSGHGSVFNQRIRDRICDLRQIT